MSFYILYTTETDILHCLCVVLQSVVDHRSPLLIVAVLTPAVIHQRISCGYSVICGVHMAGSSGEMV